MIGRVGDPPPCLLPFLDEETSMAILTDSDPKFRPLDHKVLGRRVFTLSELQRDGIILATVAAVFIVIAAVLFYKGTRSEIFNLYGVGFGFMAILAGVLAGKILYSAKHVIHVYEEGLEQDFPDKLVRLTFDSVHECKLNYISKGVSVGIGFAVSDGWKRIRITDSFGVWDKKSKRKYDAFVNYVTDQIPSTTRIEGDYRRCCNS